MKVAPVSRHDLGLAARGAHDLDRTAARRQVDRLAAATTGDRHGRRRRGLDWPFRWRGGGPPPAPPAPAPPRPPPKPPPPAQEPPEQGPRGEAREPGPPRRRGARPRPPPPRLARLGSGPPPCPPP